MTATSGLSPLRDQPTLQPPQSHGGPFFICSPREGRVLLETRESFLTSSSRQRARSVLPLHLCLGWLSRLYFQCWVQAPRLLPGLPLCPSRASVWSSKKTADQAPPVPWRFPAPRTCGQDARCPRLGKAVGWPSEGGGSSSARSSVQRTACELLAGCVGCVFSVGPALPPAPGVSLAPGTLAFSCSEKLPLRLV